VLFAMFNFTDSRTPMASSETRFVEFSEGGLQIVPASCPSNPHTDNECTIIGYSQGSYGSYSQASYGNGTDCPLGYSPDATGTGCYFTGCPQGYILQGGQCVPAENPGQCTPTYFCMGNNQYQRTAQCAESLVQYCAFGCSGAGCLSAPPGQGNIIVTPSLVRSGERTTVSWTTSGMVDESCYVIENNPEITDTGSGESNSFLSSPIRQQTSYTLTCTKEDESVFTDSATVNVIPVFEEN
jgi:hypothetical protein